MARPDQEKAVEDILTSKGDLAQLLGIDEKSSFADIQKRYRTLALLVHPDKNPMPDAKRAFQMLKDTFSQAEAYLKLRDQQLKVDATATVHSGKGKTPSAKPTPAAQPAPAPSTAASAAPTQSRQHPGANKAASSTQAFFFTCPRCSQRLRTFTEYIGMSFSCLACNHDFKIQPTDMSDRFQSKSPSPPPHEDSFGSFDDSSSASWSDADGAESCPAPPPSNLATPSMGMPSTLPTPEDIQARKEAREAKRRQPWTCTACTQLNPGKKTQCTMCGGKRFKGKQSPSKKKHPPAPRGAEKPQQPASQDKPQPPPAQPPQYAVGAQVDVLRKDGRWSSGSVKIVDTAARAYCVVGVDEGVDWTKYISFEAAGDRIRTTGKPPDPGPHQPHPKRSRPIRSKRPWTCPSCTMLNSGRSTACTVCDRPKDVEEGRPAAAQPEKEEKGKEKEETKVETNDMLARLAQLTKDRRNSREKSGKEEKGDNEHRGKEELQGEAKREGAEEDGRKEEEQEEAEKREEEERRKEEERREEEKRKEEERREEEEKRRKEEERRREEEIRRKEEEEKRREEEARQTALLHELAQMKEKLAEQEQQYQSEQKRAKLLEEAISAERRQREEERQGLEERISGEAARLVAAEMERIQRTQEEKRAAAEKVEAAEEEVRKRAAALAEELAKESKDSKLIEEAQLESKGREIVALQEQLSALLDAMGREQEEGKHKEAALREEVLQLRERINEEREQMRSMEEALELANAERARKFEEVQRRLQEQHQQALSEVARRREEQEAKELDLGRREEEIRRQQREAERRKRVEEVERRIQEEAGKRREREAMRRMQQLAARERLQSELSLVQKNVKQMQESTTSGKPVSDDALEAVLRNRRELEGRLQAMQHQIKESEEREAKLEAMMQEAVESLKQTAATQEAAAHEEHQRLVESLAATQALLEEERACSAYFADELKEFHKKEKEWAKKRKADPEDIESFIAVQMQLAESEGAKQMRRLLDKDLAEAHRLLEEERQCAEFFAAELKEQQRQVKKLEEVKKQLEEERQCAEYFAAEVEVEQRRRREMEQVAEEVAVSGAEMRAQAAAAEAKQLSSALESAVAERLTEVKRRDDEVKELQDKIAHMEKELHDKSKALEEAHKKQSSKAQQPPPVQTIPVIVPIQMVPAVPAPPPAAPVPAPAPRVPTLEKSPEPQPTPQPTVPPLHDLPIAPSSTTSPPPPPPPPPPGSPPPAARPPSDDSDSDFDDILPERPIQPPPSEVQRKPRVSCPFPDSDDDGSWGPSSSSLSPAVLPRREHVTSYKDRKGERGLFRCPRCDVAFPEDLASIDLPSTCPACSYTFLLLSSTLVMTCERAPAASDDTVAARPSPDADLEREATLSFEERRRRILAEHARQEEIFNGDISAPKDSLLAKVPATARGEETYEERKARLLARIELEEGEEAMERRGMSTREALRTAEEVASRCPCGSAPRGKCILCKPGDETPLRPTVVAPAAQSKCPCGAAPLGKCLFCDD